MNKSQKILTLVFLALFVATLIWFPRINIYGGHNYYGWEPKDMYYFVFFDYGGAPDWWKVRFEWACLVVFYVALFFMLKSPKRTG